MKYRIILVKGQAWAAEVDHRATLEVPAAVDPLAKPALIRFAMRTAKPGAPAAIGCGTVGQGLLEILDRKSTDLKARPHSLRDEDCKARTGFEVQLDGIELIAATGADIVVESTPTNIETGTAIHHDLHL